MSQNANANFITSFDAQVKKDYQADMVLRNTVRVKGNVKGSTHEFPKINKGMATKRIPQTDVVPMNIGHEKAVATLEDWNAPEYSDVFDLQKLNFDERQELVGTSRMAIGRRLDQLILDAMATSANATQVSEDVGGSNSGFNIEKVLRVGRLMDDANVPASDRHIAISARALEQALGEVEFSSADYNVTMALMKRELNYYGGFNFHIIGSRDEGGLAVATNVRNNFAWHKDAVGLAVGIEMRTEVNYIAEKTSTLINTLFSAGSVTIDDNAVYDVLTYEA